jgi:acyl CoA:acetate/3-ketoacid CoA transferase alpha subunit
MLKGPRSGYTSFSIISTPSAALGVKYTIDSVFGNKPFKAKLLKNCDSKKLTGYYYYEVKLPKKDVAFIKFTWLSANGNTAIRIDCYDSWSKYAVKLDCAK